MMKDISRRGFVKSSLLASAAIPLGLKAQGPPKSTERAGAGLPAGGEPMPVGRIAGQPFSRLIMGGINVVASTNSKRTRPWC